LNRFPLLAALFLLIPLSALAQEQKDPPESIASGELRQETALRVTTPKNFSKIKQLARVDLKFNVTPRFKIRLGGRAFYDAVYDLTDQYPEEVNDNMRKEALLRDAYLNLSLSQVNIRLGHQQIVWGEALGQFFADVVTPKDFREFFLPNFEDLRLQIWALDVQYNFLPNATLEAVLIPDQTVNKFAPQGADFAFSIPAPPGVDTILLPDNKPETDFKHWNGGFKFSWLVRGWDLAGFYYTSPDHIPALFKTLAVNPQTRNQVLILEPLHKRVHHYAATFSKGIGPTIMKGEFVYTRNRFFNAEDVTKNQGVLQRGQLRYVLGVDYTIGGKVDMNAEFQQEAIFGSREEIADQILRSWIFLRFETGFMDEKLVPELIFIVGLDRGDTLFSPRLSYNPKSYLKFTWGADIFSGPNDQLYGQFDPKDRVFVKSHFFF
jgi:hypothetical protein